MKSFRQLQKEYGGLLYFGGLAFLFIVFFASAPLFVPDANDDTYIFLRIARHLIAGEGPVFNPGERVESYSSPLWLLMLSVSGWIVGVESHAERFVALAQWLTTAFVAAIALLVARTILRLTKMRWLSIAACALTLFHPMSRVGERPQPALWAGMLCLGLLCCPSWDTVWPT